MGIFAKRNVFVMMKGPEISCARNHYQLENYIIIDFQPHCSLHFYWKGAKCNDSSVFDCVPDLSYIVFCVKFCNFHHGTGKTCKFPYLDNQSVVQCKNVGLKCVI